MTVQEAIRAFEVASAEHALALAKARLKPGALPTDVAATADALLAAAIKFGEFLPKTAEGNGG